MIKIPQDLIYLLQHDAVHHQPSHPECPYYTTEQVLEQKHYNDYIPEVKKVIDLITFGKKVEPVGSSKFAVHKYPSDIDLFEPVDGCCTISRVRERIAKKIQNIVTNIGEQKDIHFSKFQAGYDRRYDICFGTEKNGEVIDFNTNIARREIDNLWYQKLITDDERNAALDLVKDKPTVQEYLRLYWYFRSMMMLDWSAEEILKGYKELRGGKRMYLDDALIDKSLVKLDVWAEIPYPDMKNKKRYIEMTN